jgi:serine phosphatase RsbU (regulator of sigma subunit)
MTEQSAGGADNGGQVVSLRKDFEDECRALQNVLDLLGRVTAQDTVDDICRSIVEGVRDTLGYDRAGLFLFNAQSRCFHGTFGTDLNGQTCDEHDLYWQADGWESTRRIESGETFIEEELDQPHPLPGEDGIKAYMVVLRFGRKVYGVLSVDNRITRRIITQQELTYLTLFSRILGNAVEISKVRMALEHRNRRLEEELKLAQTVQLGFLPRELPFRDRILIERHYRTSYLLGGDLYDIFPVDDHRLGLYVADVAGHGVSAALIAALLKMAVDSMRKEHSARPSTDILPRPDRLLHRINEMLVRELPDDAFITMVYTVFDTDSGIFSVSRAGHESPLHYSNDKGDIIPWEVPPSPAIGFSLDHHFQAAQIQAGSGDQVMFFTDGLLEAMNTEREEFGETRLAHAFHETAGHPPQDIVHHTVQRVEQHCGDRQMEDDCTLLVAELQ